MLLQSTHLEENLEKKENIKNKIERVCGIRMSDLDFTNFISNSKQQKVELLETNFKNKRASRIDKITDINNQDIERKIFLQNLKNRILIFSELIFHIQARTKLNQKYYI